MTPNTMQYDLVEIDAQARQLRADMLAAAFRRGVAWLRNAPANVALARGRTA